MMRNIYVLIALLLGSTIAFAQTQPPVQQAPVAAPAVAAPAAAEFPIKKFEGSEIVDKAQSGFNPYKLDDENGKTKGVEGSITRLLYKASGASSYEVFRNYEEELKANGYTIIIKEGQQGTGGTKSPIMSMGSVLNGFCNQAVDICLLESGNNMGGNIFSNAEANPFYLSAKKTTDAGDAYIVVVTAEWNKDARTIKMRTGKSFSLAKGDVVIGVDYIQPKQLVKRMVQETASVIEQGLAKSGKIDLYGIYFDTDQTMLKPESDATLAQIAEVLKKDATLKLRVVGHTDSVGMPDHNQKLSDGRAQAVKAALTTKYGIDAARLQAEGKGAAQPVATNGTDDGRAKNRRVELVKM